MERNDQGIFCRKWERQGEWLNAKTMTRSCCAWDVRGNQKWVTNAKEQTQYCGQTIEPDVRLKRLTNQDARDMCCKHQTGKRED